MAWLTAAEALSVLGVRPQTLYANVSRRRIRARPDPKDPRRSLYHETDVRKLARGRSGARKAERVAAGTIEWGDPILPSALSTVAEGRLWYRGKDAVALAETSTLEDIASLLWGAPSPTLVTPSQGVGTRLRAHLDRGSVGAKPVLALMFAALAGRAGHDAPSHGRALPVLRREAAGVLSTLANTALGHVGRAMLHERMAAAWRCGRGADILRRALVLLADHELNASTFAVRVTVSTGASLAAGILAGLATLGGPLHGGASSLVFEMIHNGRRRGMRAVAREWLEQGRPFVGFGHSLYPEGDVRAKALLSKLEAPEEYQELREVVEELTGERPNIDFALAAVTETFRLRTDAPLTLFALARSVGWLAHALEQVTTGHLIRPRARYIGPSLGAAFDRDPNLPTTS